VFGLWLNVEKAAKNKLGITEDAVLTNSYADFANAFRPLSAAEKNFLQYSIEHVYTAFVGHVAEGRALQTEEVDRVGQGRVWSGKDAKTVKLIDEFGGLNDAVNLAADLAGMHDYKIQEYPRVKNSFEMLLETFGLAKAKIFASPAETLMETAPFSTLRKQHGTVQARLPYEIIIQ
jgi:protease-4